MSGRIKNSRVKEEKADLLWLCHTVPLEVVDLGRFSVWFRLKLSIFLPFIHRGQPDLIILNTGGTFYDPKKADYSDFEAWLQCYSVAGMKSVRDHNGRTMWFKVSLKNRVRVVFTSLNVLSFHRK